MDASNHSIFNTLCIENHAFHCDAQFFLDPELLKKSLIKDSSIKDLDASNS